MNKSVTSIILGVAVSVVASTASVQAVEYVRICSLYGAGFNYIPGTDVCVNSVTGDARMQTEGGTWRSVLPYPQGVWSMEPKHECGPTGKLVKVGTFASTDFELNAWNRKQTELVPFPIKSNEIVTKVLFSGGFHDPRLQNRLGFAGIGMFDGLCVRTIDPDLVQDGPNGGFIEPWGNGHLPIGCVSNARLVGMPGSYVTPAITAYPSIVHYFYTANQEVVNGPHLYGSHMVITTDMGPGGETLLTYNNANTGELALPLAGNLNVSVCVDKKK